MLNTVSEPDGQVTWNAPLTNKLLIDAGYTLHPESWALWPQPIVPWGTYPAVEQSTGVAFRAARHRTRSTAACREHASSSCPT